MKLFLKEMNIQSTVTEDSRKSFNLSPEMDKFYHDSTGVTYDIHGKYVIAYGSNSTSSSSESLSYFLNFNTERYMIGKNNNENIDTYLLNIIYAINTISCLYQANTESSSKDILFPMWYYKYDSSTQKMVYDSNGNKGQGSATDSNIEILKSLLKLYIFNVQDKYFTTQNFQGYVIPFTYTLLNIHLSDTETFSIFLKKMITCMIYNFMWGNASNPTYGNFSTNSGAYPLCFWVSCSTGTQDPGSNLIANKMADYVNFSCFIYLYQFISILGGDLTKIQTYKVSDIITDAGVSTLNFGQWSNVQNSITNFINYLSTYITSNGVTDSNINGDGIEATFNRLSYQLIHLYILLKKGDPRKSINMTSSDYSLYWNNMLPSISITTIENLCLNLIKYEITKSALKLQKITNDVNIIMGTTTKNILNPWNYTDYSTITSYVMTNYYRQLSYMCFKEIYILSNSWNNKRTDGNITYPTNSGSESCFTYYFENYGFGYFGFTEYSNPLAYSLQSIVDTYLYDPPSTYNTSLDYYKDSVYSWKKGCNTWNGGNNNPYFAWSVCSLHQINYNLYKGI